MKTFRPWGTLNWIMSQLSVVPNWSLLGALGTEERSLAAWRQLNTLGKLGFYSLLNIIDVPSRHSALFKQRDSERKAEFVANAGDLSKVHKLQITAEHFRIVESLKDFLSAGGEDVIVDITSMPKRFFFPVIRLLQKDLFGAPRNIIVTYSIPERYTRDNLAENFGDWAHLPLFEGNYSAKKATNLVIGVGFEALGLLDRVETSEAGRRISFLLPFPAPIKAFQRSWELLRRLQEHQPPDSYTVHRVDVRDASDAFDRLLSVTDRGKIMVDLAPFGPKPMSLAMCLYASAVDCPVFYTQPTVYHPDYSTGTLVKSGEPEIYAYALRIDGNNLYAL